MPFPKVFGFETVNKSASRGALTPTDSTIERNRSMNIYYVYAYTYNDGSPYYIGKGKGNRAYIKHQRNLLPRDRSCIVILKESLSEKEAHDLETELIKAHGRLDLGTGPLKNLTNGGEGASGSLGSKKYNQRVQEEWNRYSNLSPEEWIKEAEEFWRGQ